MDSVGYKILLLLHVVTVVIAFGANFAQPMLARAGIAGDAFAKAATHLQLPSIAAVLITGMGMVGLSDKVWKFSQAWVSIAFVVAILAGVVLYLLGKAHKAGEQQHVAMYTGAMHLLLVIGLYAMIWKPGL